MWLRAVDAVLPVIAVSSRNVSSLGLVDSITNTVFWWRVGLIALALAA